MPKMKKQVTIDLTTFLIMVAQGCVKDIECTLTAKGRKAILDYAKKVLKVDAKV